MIKLKDILLTEAGKENRINSMRLVTILESCMVEVSKTDQKQIMELLSRVIAGITKVNEMPYSYYHGLGAWQMTCLAEVELPAKDLREKLNELLKKSTEKLNTETVVLAINAIDELYVY